MPKIKTHGATAKRYVVKRSKSGTKIMKRADGQDHFNARQTGNTRRNKRRDNSIKNAMKKNITNAVPNY